MARSVAGSVPKRLSIPSFAKRFTLRYIVRCGVPVSFALPAMELPNKTNGLSSSYGGEGKKEDQEEPASLVLAGGAEEGKEMAGAIHNALALLEGILGEAPPEELKELLELLFSGRGLYLYVR